MLFVKVVCWVVPVVTASALFALQNRGAADQNDRHERGRCRRGPVATFFSLRELAHGAAAAIVAERLRPRQRDELFVVVAARRNCEQLSIFNGAPVVGVGRNARGARPLLVQVGLALLGRELVVLAETELLVSELIFNLLNHRDLVG